LPLVEYFVENEHGKKLKYVLNANPMYDYLDLDLQDKDQALKLVNKKIN
jgi:hypothetical protein